MNSKPSVILFGSKPGSVVALELMLQKAWKVLAVVPSGNHPFIAGDRLNQVADSMAIPVLTQEKLIDELGDQRVDFVISYMFRNKVKPKSLSLANRAALNFHAGPLPEYGGWAFYNLAILENETEYGCTCHYMDDGFDTGSLLKVRKFAIDTAKETAVSLERKAQAEMINLFCDFMELAENQTDFPKQDQDKTRMRYLSKTEFEKLKEIPHNADEETKERIARAFFYPPYECAYVNIDGIKFEVIPNIIKQQLAKILHQNDLEDLRNIAKYYQLHKSFE